MYELTEKKKRIGICLGIAGLLLAIIDIEIAFGPWYPAYEAFHSEAPKTVAMVIEQVRGSRMKVDVLPDIVGYVLMVISCITFWNTKSQKESGRKFFRRPVVSLLLAWALDIFYIMIPFVFNGNYRYRLTYGFYFLALLVHTWAVFSYAMCYAHASENVHNHQDNNVTVIIMMFGFLASGVREVISFYQIHWGAAIYYVAAVVLLGIAAYRFYRERNYMVL